MFNKAISKFFRAQCHIPTLRQLHRSCSSISAVGNQEPRSPIQAIADDQTLSVQWNDATSRFHHAWLRHHCPCPACLDPSTKQRKIDLALIPGHIRPLEVQVAKNEVRVRWDDGHESSFDGSWLQENAYDGFVKDNVKPGYGSIAYESEIMLWNKKIIEANPPPEYNFDEIKNNPSLIPSLIDKLFRFGFLFVNETPHDKESLAQVCEFIGGHVQESLYGRVYALENKDLTHSDVAYLSNALHGHTDHAYFEAPAGIQLMHCTHHHGTGGISLLVDGFNAAKTLYKEKPEAFKILASTEVPFEYNSQHHMTRVHGPLLELNPFNHELVRVRYNNSRVGPFTNMNLTFEEMGKFYQAVQTFGSILRRPENELWFNLTPGRVIAMDNSRTLHGRSDITGSRRLLGSYVAIDDFLGKWRAIKSASKKMD